MTGKKRHNTVDKRERKEKKHSYFLIHSYFGIVKSFVKQDVNKMRAIPAFPFPLAYSKGKLIRAQKKCNSYT